MTNFKDITGRKFGRLTALKIHLEEGKRTQWLCKCECGNEKLIPLSSLSSGKGKSCGCLRKELTGEKFRKHGLINTTLYNTWLNMRDRCRNKKSPSYKNYGARGIDVCAEWDDYKKFYEWALNNGYKKSLTIDRIDNDKGYYPENCRWATKETQANNTTKNVRTEIDGVERTLSEHARFYKINYFTIHYRYEKGIRGIDLVSKPARKKIIITINGEQKSLKAWSEHFGINYGTAQWRYKAGLRGEELFKPVKNQNQNQRCN